jgi:hypothetical protein
LDAAHYLVRDLTDVRAEVKEEGLVLRMNVLP